MPKLTTLEDIRQKREVVLARKAALAEGLKHARGELAPASSGSPAAKTKTAAATPSSSPETPGGQKESAVASPETSVERLAINVVNKALLKPRGKERTAWLIIKEIQTELKKQGVDARIFTA